MASLASVFSVKMNLANVIYISYRVPVQRVRHLIPAVLEINSDADDMACISFVTMKCHRVRLAAVPWPQFNYDQLNLRTYVKDPKTGCPAVYFFRSGVSLGIIPLVTRLVGIPWEKISFSLQTEGTSGYRASGKWMGNLDFQIVSPQGELPQESIVEHLTGPTMGFMGSSGKLRSFKISHHVLEVRSARLNYIDFPMSINTGMIMESELQHPNSVLVVEGSEFTVYLPPRRII